MYIPTAFDIESRSEILTALRGAGFGHLVTNGPTEGPDGLMSTALPFVVDDELEHVIAHFARANPHWRTIDRCNALLIVSGLDAYVSPRWYPSKNAHGKVVPTWNYELIHLHGTIEIHDDPLWTRRAVTDLTRQSERNVSDAEFSTAWDVSDAPAEFIEQQLRAIVGVQLNITKIEAKRKLSQNRSHDDRTGVIGGLGRSDDPRHTTMARTMHSGPEII